MGFPHEWEITCTPIPTREIEEPPNNTQNYTHMKDVLSENLVLAFPHFRLENGRAFKSHFAVILEY